MARQTKAPRFLRLPEVLQMICLGKTSIYARINEGTFPRQIPIGSNSVVWLEKDVVAWMEKQMEEA